MWRMSIFSVLSGIWWLWSKKVSLNVVSRLISLISLRLYGLSRSNENSSIYFIRGSTHFLIYIRNSVTKQMEPRFQCQCKLLFKKVQLQLVSPDVKLDRIQQCTFHLRIIQNNFNMSYINIRQKLINSY